MQFWGLLRTSPRSARGAAGAAYVIGFAILAWTNQGRAGDLPPSEPMIAAEIARDFNVPTVTLPFQKIKCAPGADGDCDGPVESAAGIGLLKVVAGPTVSFGNIGPEQVCAPLANKRIRAPESDTTKLGQKSYSLPAAKVREKLDQLLDIELPAGSYENFQFIVIGAAQDQSDYPPPRFRREVADACPGKAPLLVTRLVRARLGLSFDEQAILAQPLRDRLKKSGFVQGGSRFPNLYVSAEPYLLGFFALPLQTP